MKSILCEQKSPEWWSARRGIPTASEFHRIVTPAKGTLSDQADGYICDLISDRLATDDEYMASGYQSDAMANGTALEPAARDWYAFDCDQDVQQVGFCVSDDGRYGASPDGLIGQDGCLEIKCPQRSTHIKYLLDGGLPTKYKCQCHGVLWVTGRKWLDFMSYCEGLPPLIVRVYRDAFTESLGRSVIAFCVKLEESIQKIEGKRKLC
jgi:hypothetical protein